MDFRQGGSQSDSRCGPQESLFEYQRRLLDLEGAQKEQGCLRGREGHHQTLVDDQKVPWHWNYADRALDCENESDNALACYDHLANHDHDDGALGYCNEDDGLLSSDCDHDHGIA